MYQVLLLCSNNSILSPMAEGYFRSFSDTQTEVYSAGVELTKHDPDMLRVMKMDGIDMTGIKQYIVSDLRHVDFDYILTFDSESAEESHHFPSKSVKYHYQFDQFLLASDLEDKEEVYISLRNRMKKIIRSFVKEYFSSGKAS
jgi:protein-tyrosine-phosphatase